jgi:molybdopterin synthase catalytic subunit
MFVLTDKKITQTHITEWKKTFTKPTVGAAVIFEGLVRNHNEGKEVKSLEYSSYPEMAIKVGNNIITKTRELYSISDVFCVHVTGHLEIGDIAVWVIATASHRIEAFNACQFVIDEVKSLVPIWKKEHYKNQAADWIACTHCGNHHHE